MKYTIKYFPENQDEFLIKRIKNILTNQKYIYDENDYDLIIIVGGDGTFLHFFKQHYYQNKKIIMINSGNIGFYASCTIDELSNYLKRDDLYFSLDMLMVQNGTQKYVGLNEMTTFSFNALPITVSLNSEIWYTFNGSGFIVATANGSSGSNKSNSGPLIDPSLHCYAFSEILSINNARFKSLGAPIVINGKKEIQFEWNEAKKLQFAIDNTQIQLNCSKIIINLIQSKAKLLMTDNIMFKKWSESFLK